MTTIVLSTLLCLAIFGALLLIRERDLPKAAPVSPFQHLDERKAAIYENLRDLQFEYRVGKLSDEDYQRTKLEMQKELAHVLADVDALKAELQLAPAPAPVARAPVVKQAAVSKKTAAVLVSTVCPACGAAFAESLKFCGECGAAIAPARERA